MMRYDRVARRILKDTVRYWNNKDNIFSNIFINYYDYENCITERNIFILVGNEGLRIISRFKAVLYINLAFPIYENYVMLY